MGIIETIYKVYNDRETKKNFWSNYIMGITNTDILSGILDQLKFVNYKTDENADIYYTLNNKETCKMTDGIVVAESIAYTFGHYKGGREFLIKSKGCDLAIMGKQLNFVLRPEQMIVARGKNLILQIEWVVIRDMIAYKNAYNNNDLNVII